MPTNEPFDKSGSFGFGHTLAPALIGCVAAAFVSVAAAQPPLKAPSAWGAEDTFRASLTAVRTQTDFPALRTARHPDLQRSLEVGLDVLNLQGAIDRKVLGIAVVDITDPVNPRMAAVNGDRHFYAASLPKIAILLGVMDAVEAGDVEWTENIQNDVTRMIRVSSNTAATAMYRLAGPKRIANLLQSPQYRLYDTKYNGGLWAGKPYGKGAAWKRDPLHNTSHGATALQVARFFYLMETGRLVSYDASERMKAALSKPGIRHKFVKGLARHPDAKIYRKSGSWRHYHADGAVVERDGRTYIAVGLAEDNRGGDWLTRVINVMDTAVFDTAPEPEPEVGPRSASPLGTTLSSVTRAQLSTAIAGAAR